MTTLLKYSNVQVLVYVLLPIIFMLLKALELEVLTLRSHKGDRF